MTRRVIGAAWLGALLALILVALLPACWLSGKLQAATSEAPLSSSSGDEERDDSALREDGVVEAARLRPRPAAQPRPVSARRPGLAATAPAERFVARGTPRWSARFSVRRLI